MEWGTLDDTQAFGSVARRALGELMEGEVVEAQQVDKDPCGRVVASVHVGGVSVNREQVAEGFAWR